MRIQKGFGGDEQREPENPVLVEAMQQLTEHDTPQTRRHFYEALLQSTLLLPTAQEMEDIGSGSQTLKRATSVSLMMGRTASGEEVLLVFTDPAAMHQWNPDSKYYMGLSADELFIIAVQSDIALMVINPSGPVKGKVTAAEMQLLAQGILPDTPHTVETSVIPAQTEINLSAPTEAELPSLQLRHQIKTILAQYSDIAAAYMFMMSVPPQPMTLVTGVCFDQNTTAIRAEAVMRQIINQVTALLEQDEAVNFVVLGEALLYYVDETVAPFYIRKSD